MNKEELITRLKMYANSQDQSGYQIGWNSVVFLGGFRYLDLGAVYGALAPSLDRAVMQERNNGNRESEHASH